MEKQANRAYIFGITFIATLGGLLFGYNTAVISETVESLRHFFIEPLHLSSAVAAQWVSNFLISWTFPIMDKNETLVSNFNHGFAYWVYGILAFIAAIFVWKKVLETKGKSLEDMENIWKK